MDEGLMLHLVVSRQPTVSTAAAFNLNNYVPLKYMIRKMGI